MINLEKEDRVNHPSHYQLKDGTEVIKLIKLVTDDFIVGNALKYIMRAGKKTESNYAPFQKEIEDLEKAIWYLNYRINELKEQQKIFNENYTEDE